MAESRKRGDQRATRRAGPGGAGAGPVVPFATGVRDPDGARRAGVDLAGVVWDRGARATPPPTTTAMQERGTCPTAGRRTTGAIGPATSR
jgi:hypothetical protein